MSAGAQYERDAQLADRERSQADAADVTVTRIASPKATTTPCAELQFGAVRTNTRRAGRADQNGGTARVLSDVLHH
jgi:hypothetical protein